MKKIFLSLLLTVCMVLSILPIGAFATEGENSIGASSIQDAALCEHHAEHNEDCGYAPETEEIACNHQHDDACGLIQAVEAIPAREEIPCDKECTDTDDESVIDHADDCAYTPAVAEIPSVEGAPCNHQHDDACGYAAAAKGEPCTFVCEICNAQQKKCTCEPVIEGDGVHTSADCPFYEEKAELECNCKTKCTVADEENKIEQSVNADCPVCGVENADLTLCAGSAAMLWATPRSTGIVNETTANGQYHLSYNSGIDTISPTVTGSDNAPVLTFTRGDSDKSGGVITSNYTMDFTRSFNIEGKVDFAERDGVSFALHTTPNKTSYTTDYNTCMLAPSLLNGWARSTLSFPVTEEQNDITNGLLWDFMQYNNPSYAPNTRFQSGAYSYQIKTEGGSTTVNALGCDEEGSGILHPDVQNTSGDFKLSWQCTDADTATGKLTFTMGEGTTFTYTGLVAKEVFGSLQNAKAVYFSFSTFLPSFNTGSGESKEETQIAIEKAYYTDTDDGSGKSTLGVETSYYIDTDGNGTYETQLKKATLVGADQTVLCRNKIYNKNKSATSAMDMTLLIPNLSKVAGSTETTIESIANEKFYTHEAGATAESQDNSKMSSQGAGPLNSTAPLTDYVKVTLPAGGDGSSAYDDAYAVYEYTFTPGANVTAFNQTIQLGVAPFTPAFLSSTIFFNSPEAFKPDNTEGKILFGTDGAGGKGLYRVADKDSTSVTLFYNDADISGSGMAHDAAIAWLKGTFWNALTVHEQAALLPYGRDSIIDKVVLPSEDEVKNSGTWEFDDNARATAESGQSGTDWWLRTLGAGNTAKTVTQNGTQTVDIETTQTKGVRPVMRLNLANVLFTKDRDVSLTESPSGTLTSLSAVGSETAPFRLTLLDANRNFAVLEDNSNIDVAVGDVITFHYTDATVGENCYVSALLSNSAGQDIYYGRLKAISTESDANGTATVAIPSAGLGNGAYTLKLFSETIHADKASDVASALQAITLELGNNLNGTVAVTGTAEYGCTLTATVTNSNYLGTLRYQWKREGAAIDGAADSSYTLMADDIGKAITCEVADSGGGHRDNTISSAATTIAKRTLTAKADNKRITKGQTLPSFTVTCSGFVFADTVDGVFENTPTAAVGAAVDGKTSGTFPIAVAAALAADKNGLYQLSTQDGILTVSTPSSDSSYDFYTITATAGAGGEISTGKYVSVSEGDSAVFTFTPNQGYQIADVLVNGRSVGAKNSYTFTSVRSNHTLHVTFKAANGHVNPQTGVGFEDVQDSNWFCDAVYAAVEKGWFAGASATSFSPNRTTARAQVATVFTCLGKLYFEK